MTERRSLAELRLETFGETTQAAFSTPVPCIGDGDTGNRIQAVYAHGVGNDRSATVVPLIQQWSAQNLEYIVSSSAMEKGGTRSVRFVTTPSGDSCQLSVLKVQLSATGLASLDGTASELEAAGLDRSDRRYVVWVDANVYCGIAQSYVDDSQDASNANNGVSYLPGTVARIDNGCWGRSGGTPVEAHELFHTLGAVQDSAPNTSGYGHCTDENDVMCYQDHPTTVMRTVCSDAAAMRLLDCGGDDYFNLNPPDGSYLDTHWNTADSSFLANSLADPCTKSGTVGNDLLIGTAGPDVLCGLGGNDTFRGLGGNDIFYGGPGTDSADYSTATAAIKADLLLGQVTGNTIGSDALGSIEGVIGSPKNDELRGSASSDRLIGGGGHDFLLGREGNDKLVGGAGGDDLNAEEGNDSIDGGKGEDSASYWGSSSGVVVDLGAGTATGQGSDSLRGIENVNGSPNADKITGNAGPNRISTWTGDDELYGLGGKDVLSGSDGIDRAYGGTGDDYLTGGAGNDFLYGQAGLDAFDGGAGRDKCSPGAGGYYYKVACE